MISPTCFTEAQRKTRMISVISIQGIEIEIMIVIR